MVYTVIILIQEVMTMILSVSRRTDIPRYYSEWFYNRIKKGFCFVKNPMNPRQISRIDLSPDAVDCLVFWSRDPGPMLERLDELSSYSYYFQFTMTGYGKDVEPGAPPANEALTTFKKLSMRTGPHRVIWRYDPIMFTERYTPEYHLHAFSRLAAGLLGILLGTLGVHNFYLGFTTRGVVQLLVSIIGGIFTCGMATVAIAVWGFVEGVLLLAASPSRMYDGHGVILRD